MEELKKSETIYFVDFNVGLFNFGMKTRPLILDKSGLKLGKKQIYWNVFRLLLSPKVMAEFSKLLLRPYGARLSVNSGNIDPITYPTCEFESYKYSEIKKLSLKKTKFKDKYIEMELRGKRKTFFVANKVNVLNSETRKLYSDLKNKI